MLYSKLRKVALKTIALALIAMLWTSVMAYAAPVMNKSANKGTYKIVAVGDSVAAGYEHGYDEQSVPYGFVEHVYEQALFHGLRAEYENYGVLGLRTTGLNNWMSAVVQGTESVKSGDIQANLPDPRAERIFNETKQLRLAISDASLILINIGGNDMYAVLDKLKKDANQSEAAIIRDSALQTYETKLEASLRLILSLQPNVQLVIADQYLPIPAPVKVGSLVFPLFPEKDRLFLLDSVKQLRERLDLLVHQLTQEGFRVNVANVAAAFMNNELSFTSIAEGDIHPSREGYAAMGKAFSKTIWGDYRVVKPRVNDVPVSVVVNGKELAGAHQPLLAKNKTYVPLRDIADAAGAIIKWNAASQTATVSLQGVNVAITVGASNLSINGAIRPLIGPPAFLRTEGKASTLYVPLAALSDGLQLQVVYRDKLKTVFINK